MKSKKNTKPVKAGKVKSKRSVVTSTRKTKAKAPENIQFLKEAASHYSVTSRIRPIGNSKGIILSNRIIEEAGISPDADLKVQASEGMIIIAQIEHANNINTDLTSWDEHFKKAIKQGKSPEADPWTGINNKFDLEEWT